MRAMLTIIGITLLCAFAIRYNSQVTHLQKVGSDQFCMYMGPEREIKNLRLKMGLVGCFKGDPYNVNEFDHTLTNRMWESQRNIVYSFEAKESRRIASGF